MLCTANTGNFMAVYEVIQGFSYIIHAGIIRFCRSMADNSFLRQMIAPAPRGTDALSKMPRTPISIMQL